ncbi:MAG: hypothetical protein E7378_02505 [Clostridiales bacterium]|nr:hypothetical protein [Clostridiales bacterium]
MGMFDNILQTDEQGNVIFNQWIEWEHFAIPNKPQWFREILRNIMALFQHCMVCTVLDGCYFVDNNCPPQPLHMRCECKKRKILLTKVKQKANAICDITKFTEYIFDENRSKGKNKIFNELGFTKDDSLFLQQEFCKQALKQYLLGNYKLKNLDKRGQRLAIPINLNNKTFYSGWILYPEGLIRNTTPFGGWVK